MICPRPIRFLLASAMSLSAFHMASGREAASWSTDGRDLLEKCTSSNDVVVHACGEYLLGVMDGVIAALPADSQLICPPASISFFNLESAFSNWAQRNPNLLSQSRLRAAVSALSTTFPCH